MARNALGVILLLVGGGIVVLSLLLALFVFATSASHGSGQLAMGMIFAGLVASVGLACVVGGIVALVVRKREPGGSSAPHEG